MHITWLYNDGAYLVYRLVQRLRFSRHGCGRSGPGAAETTFDRATGTVPDLDRERVGGVPQASPVQLLEYYLKSNGTGLHWQCQVWRSTCNLSKLNIGDACSLKTNAHRHSERLRKPSTTVNFKACVRLLRQSPKCYHTSNADSDCRLIYTSNLSRCSARTHCTHRALVPRTGTYI